MSDEAHRSQYDTLALNMRSALPNALFLAFTGTPLIVGEISSAKPDLVIALYRAVKPDPAAIEFASRCGGLAAIADEIRTTVNPPDISHVLDGIYKVLDESIAAVPFTIGDEQSG